MEIDLDELTTVAHFLQNRIFGRIDLAHQLCKRKKIALKCGSETQSVAS